MVTERTRLKKVSQELNPVGGIAPARYEPKEGWLTFVFVLLLVLSVVWSVELADWVENLPSITVTAFLGVTVGMLLAKIKKRGILLHPIALAAGYLLLVWQTRDLTEGGGLFTKSDDLFSRIQIWLTAAESGGISADPLPFITIIFTVAWLLSYFSSWFIFRSLRLWPVLVPTALALFLNLLYLPDKFRLFFYLYILAALLLAMRIHFLRERARWHRDEVPYFRKANSSFAWVALILGSLVVFTVWAIPRTDFSPDFLRNNWAVLSTPWKSLETALGRVLPFLPAQKPYTIHKFGDAFPFRGASSLGDHVVMRISSTRPSYWKAETFDVYTHQGWLSGDRTVLTDEFKPVDDVVTYTGASTIEQRIELGVSSDALFAAANPLYTTRAFTVEIAPPMTFEIDLDSPTVDANLPKELVPVAEAIRKEAKKGVLTFTDIGALRDLPEDTIVKEIVRDGNRAVKVVLSRSPPNPPDITALRPDDELKPFDKYDAISYESQASEEALRLAGTDYPSWVTDRYLQLPDDLPKRVRGLSEGLTRSRGNPYDKALAIRDWLRKIPFYSTDIDPLPQDADGVDHFLFETKKGYSTYFSSSMTVMLRSIGIPARLAVGYSTGEWDDQQQVYVVRSSNAHSWPEVYFPRYGWIPFEPVPIADIFTRGGVMADGTLELPQEVTQVFRAGDPPGMEDSGFDASSGGFLGWMPLWVFVPLVAALALLLFLAVLARAWVGHGLSGLDYPSEVYIRMTRLAALGGFAPLPNHTPREYALALAIEMDVVEGDVERIGEAYAYSRYRPLAGTADDQHELKQSWRSLRKKLLFWSLKRRLRHGRSGR